MFAKELLLGDTRYSAWSTQRLLDAASALTPEERTRDLGQSHHSVVATLNHCFISERFWVGCLIAHELPPMHKIGTSAPPPDLSIEELQHQWPEVWSRLEDWLVTLSESELAKPIPCEIAPGKSRDFPRWEIIRHNVNHASLHRGQVVGMLRQLGEQPPNVDIMSFYIQN
ncbi:MAG: DinB family protein [Candidatus Acidiferrales bacterium]